MKKLIVLLLLLIPEIVFTQNLEDLSKREGSIWLESRLGVGGYFLAPDYTLESFLEYDDRLTPLLFADLSVGYKFTPALRLSLETSGNFDSETAFFEKSGENDLRFESYKFFVSPMVISKINETKNQFLKALFYLKYRETKETFTGSIKAKYDFIYIDKNNSSQMFLKGTNSGIKKDFFLREYLILSSPDTRDTRVGLGYFELKEEGLSRLDELFGLGFNTIGITEFESKGVMLEAYAGKMRSSGLYSHFYLRYGLNNNLKTLFGKYKERINDKNSIGFINYGGNIGYRHKILEYKNLNFFIDSNASYLKKEWTMLKTNSNGKDEVIEEDEIFKVFLSIGCLFF